jgi:proteic killer suppression protein
MNVEFANADLDWLETDQNFTMGLSPTLVRAYRKRLQQIRAAPDERDFYALKSLHFEKLKGSRQHQRSMRLNDQFRLVIELREAEEGKIVRIVAVEDYH